MGRPRGEIKPVNQDEKNYGFRFMCKDFELEIRGDQRFVEKTLGRYENKLMQKLREFLPHNHAPEPREAESGRLAAAPASVFSSPSAEATASSPAGEKKSRHRRGRGRRGKRRRESQESAPAAGEPAPEAVPAAASEPVKEPAVENAEPREGGFAPVEEPVALAFLPPPLENVRPSAPEFPLRRRPPKVDPEALKTLLEEKRPRTHHDRIMLMGYHLENAAGGSDFTAEEVVECYQAANELLPANLTQVLNHATRSGFIVRHDHGRIQRFKLSARGRRYVEDGLKLL